ncbi:hypothetical protein Pcinc_011317 [Petrolisthes cinctipes]|uniref:Myb/SANT-like DNA-binding domain-containing protein n=1 Tax=Petrolisthes cinctipes TaxID=88211 RepID=A0AAE1G177_PETCI|nr:hypothetical protein Pcinc_011317 [Petrolisthes cinctipes]
MPHYTALTTPTDPSKMSYQPPVLSNGVTNPLLDYPAKEDIQPIQSDAVYCHEVFDGHDGQSSDDPGTTEDRQGSVGPFDRPPQKSSPWDSEMTHFFINEYRNVSGMVTKKRDAFLHISEKMNQKGYDVTPYTVEKKWHNLIKAYKNVLYRAIRKGDEKISWEYFEEMDDIIKNSTPSLPAPGNLKRLALSRKVSPNPVASPASGPETISVTPDFLPSPPSPEVTTPKTLPVSSPSLAENVVPCAPYSIPAGPSTNRSPPGHLASSPVSYVVNPPTSHPSLTPAEAHMMQDTAAQVHSPYYPTQHHHLAPPPQASTPTTVIQPQQSHPTILNTPSIPMPPPTPTHMDHQSMNNQMHYSSGYTAYPPQEMPPSATEPMHQQLRPQWTTVRQEEFKIKQPPPSLARRRKSKLRKAKIFARRSRRPDIELLVAQREMNIHLKTLNSNIISMGHTLNENIVGLKRAVERMVSIMLQNKPGT